MSHLEKIRELFETINNEEQNDEVTLEDPQVYVDSSVVSLPKSHPVMQTLNTYSTKWAREVALQYTYPICEWLFGEYKKSDGKKVVISRTSSIFRPPLPYNLIPSAILDKWWNGLRNTEIPKIYERELREHGAKRGIFITESMVEQSFHQYALKSFYDLFQHKMDHIQNALRSNPANVLRSTPHGARKYSVQLCATWKNIFELQSSASSTPMPSSSAQTFSSSSTSTPPNVMPSTPAPSNTMPSAPAPSNTMLPTPAPSNAMPPTPSAVVPPKHSRRKRKPTEAGQQLTLNRVVDEADQRKRRKRKVAMMPVEPSERNGPISKQSEVPTEQEACKGLTNMQSQSEDQVRRLVCIYWQTLLPAVSFSMLPSYRKDFQVNGTLLSQLFKGKAQQGPILLELYRCKKKDDFTFTFAQARNYFAYIIRERYITYQQEDQSFREMITTYGTWYQNPKTLSNAPMGDVAIALLLFEANINATFETNEWEKTQHPIEAVVRGFPVAEFASAKQRLTAVFLRLLMWMVFPPTTEHSPQTEEESEAIERTRRWMTIVDSVEADLFASWDLNASNLSGELPATLQNLHAFA